MTTLRTVFWVALAVAALLFSFANWTSVNVTLWGAWTMDIKLPLLLLAAFLLGLLPMLVIHRTTRWSMRRQLHTAQADLRTQAEAFGGPAAEPLSSPPRP